MDFKALRRQVEAIERDSTSPKPSTQPQSQQHQQQQHSQQQQQQQQSELREKVERDASWSQVNQKLSHCGFETLPPSLCLALPPSLAISLSDLLLNVTSEFIKRGDLVQRLIHHLNTLTCAQHTLQSVNNSMVFFFLVYFFFFF